MLACPHVRQRPARVSKAPAVSALGFQQQCACPERPIVEEPGAPIANSCSLFDGLPCPGDVVAMQPDHGLGAMAGLEGIGRPGFLGEVDTCFEFGGRVVPCPGEEPFHREVGLVGRQRPSDAELIAKSSAVGKCLTGRLILVDFHQDPPARGVHRELVAGSVGTAVSEGDRLVAQLERLCQLAVHARDDGLGCQRCGRGAMVAGAHSGRVRPLGVHRRVIEVAEPEACQACFGQAGETLGFGAGRRTRHDLQFA